MSDSILLKPPAIDSIVREYVVNKAMTNNRRFDWLGNAVLDFMGMRREKKL